MWAAAPFVGKVGARSDRYTAFLFSMNASWESRESWDENLSGEGPQGAWTQW